MQSFFAEHLDHVLRAVALRIHLTAVADERDVEEIPRIVRHVIHTPELLFIPDWILVRCELLVALHIRKSGSSVNTGPLIGIMRPKMPRSGTAHAEARQCDAIGVNVETLRGIIPAFKHIRLACALPTIAVTAKRVNHDGFRRLKLSRLLRHQA